MKPEYFKAEQIKLNPNNPRIIKDDKFKKLVKSIQEFPEMMELRPIVVDEDMVILGGNMRFRAMREAGLQLFPVVVAKGLSEEQKQEFIIKDNVGFGDWDYDTLANEWDSEKLGDWGVEKISGIKGDIVGDFSDVGSLPENKFGVIVMCESEQRQEAVYRELTSGGYKCKVVVV